MSIVRLVRRFGVPLSVFMLFAVSAFPASAAESPTLSLPTSVPAAPSNLAVTPVSPNAIRLKWQDNSNNEQGFEITNNLESRYVGPNVTTYKWGGLAPGTYECFKVRAYNSAGYSDWEPNVPPWYVCTTTPQL